MTLAEKLNALAAMAANGREEEAYQGMDWLQRNRSWPDWLKRVAADVDGPAVTKDRPVNMEIQHERH